MLPSSLTSLLRSREKFFAVFFGEEMGGEEEEVIAHLLPSIRKTIGSATGFVFFGDFLCGIA